MREVTLATETPDATRALGEQLGRAILATPNEAPLMIALMGELGAGKTTLVGALLRGMGVTGAVRSPTYTLIEPYEHLGPQGKRSVYHLDLYRLVDARDLEMLAPRDLLQPGAVLLVEWAERAGTSLPAPDLSVQLRYVAGSSAAANHRSIVLTAHSLAGAALTRSLAL